MRISKLTQLFYREYYRELLIQRFGNEYSDIITFISFIPNRNVDYEKILADNKAKTERENRILRQLSPWDGSHTNLKRLIKANMNDPKSFEHIETTYKDKEDYILVQMKYRGKNAFGAKVIDMVTAKVDVDGNILSISNK
ncbi:MAG: hypothetical protein KL787_03400 [Taibaiella sp.]|nr:hypothetical protein [Taibaiella sp.]